MKFDWEAEIILLQDPLYRETRTRDLSRYSLSEKHAYIFHLYSIHNQNDDIMMWILQTIADIYNEMDSRWPGHCEEITEQLQQHMNMHNDMAELLAERLAIMALLR